MMSIFFIDQRATKCDMVEALVSFQQDHDIEKVLTEAAAFVDAINFSASYRPTAYGHLQGLIMANNPDRAIKLVQAVNDYELRRWIKIPLLVLLWPFIFLVRIIKMGLPS
jgi:hypothetical protein